MSFVPFLLLVLQGIRASSDVRMTMWPGLAGIAGALTLFPMQISTDGLVYLALLVPVAAVSVALLFFDGPAKGWEARRGGPCGCWWVER